MHVLLTPCGERVFIYSDTQDLKLQTFINIFWS